MLNLYPNEVKIIRAWSEHGQSSPFPQEIALLNRLKRNISNRNMTLSTKELNVVLHWADRETKGHHGTERYLLEHEAELLNKIENFLIEEKDL